MTPESYITEQLSQLKKSCDLDAPKTNDTMVEFIYSKIMSKKFRKFSVPEINKETIRNEIVSRVEANEPIVIHYPFGGYKLWRLEESPEVDWGELFSTMYYIKWLKPICEVYKPGIHFVYRFDEVVVKKLNNIPEEETEAYRKSFGDMLKFLKEYAPKNFSFEIFLERSRYESYETFEKELQVEIDALRAEREKNPYKLSEAERAMIELNVRLESGQSEKPNWQEENDLIHIAYYSLQNNKKHPRKHYEHEGIVAFPFMFETNNIVAVGTTKTSTAKFWVGVGALKKRNESYIETVLSPKQLEKANYEWTPTSIEGLSGKNFTKIRVIQ